MDAAELRVALTLNPETWSLTLRAESEVIGEVETQATQIPFSTDELALFERALDLNADEGLKRSFGGDGIARLRALDLLRNPPPEEGVGAVLNGGDIHREALRRRVRDWLSQMLLDPLAAPIDQHFSAQLATAPGTRPILYLRLELRPDRDLPLLRLPWELLQQHRLSNGEIQIGRYLRYAAVPGLPPPAHRLSILVLQSDPSDPQLTRLHLREREHIDTGLRESRFGTAFTPTSIEPASYVALLDALRAHRNQPVVLHFAGHGDFGWRCEQCGAIAVSREGNPCGNAGCGFVRHGEPTGFLAFTDAASGRADWVGISGLRNALANAGVRLLVLSACKSATSRGGRDVFNGIAQQLMDIVPAVVATPFPLATEAAEAFARLLYRGLGDGLPLAEALHEAQQAMVEPYPDEWYRPVLYLRSRQGDAGRLLEVEAEPKPSRWPHGAAGATTGPVADRRRALQTALALLQQQYNAAMQQSVTSIDAAARVQAEQQAADLERRIRGIEGQLAGPG